MATWLYHCVTVVEQNLVVTRKKRRGTRSFSKPSPKLLPFSSSQASAPTSQMPLHHESITGSVCESNALMI